MKSNLLIRASAGSGKTRQLSLRYLELIARGVPIPRILASTFTKKATGEILNRILLTAAQACRDDALRSELAQNADREISPEEMQGIMRQLVTGLNLIRACSLDSFFQKIASCFPYEIGLKSGWKILNEVDDAHLHWDAIQETLYQNRKNTQTLIRQLFKGENKTTLANEISDQIKNLLSLKREANENAWKALMDPTIWVPGEKNPFRWFLNEAEIVEILDFLENEVEKINENPNGKTKLRDALNRIIPKIRVNDWSGLANETLIQHSFQARSGGALLFNRREIEELRSPLIRIACHSAAVYFRLMQEQVLALYELLDGYSAYYDQSKLDANGLSFDDVTRYTAEFIEKLNGNLQPIFWRMNSSIDHLLLDEFQDTSLNQWRIFLPFGKYCTEGDGRTFFCVGDIKQAIYRWRNGRSEIFDAIENTFPNIEQESSNTSWRSAPEILRCVNRLFYDAAKNPADPKPEPFACGIEGVPFRSLLNSTAQAAWDTWQFEAHKASPKSKNYPGYWELRTMCEKDSKDPVSEDGDDDQASSAENAQLKWVADQIAEIHRNAGNCHRIGVLFRRNTKMPQVARFLREKGIPVSEDGNNPLTTSTAVRLLLSLLSLMDFPDSTMDWFYVGNSPIAERYPELAWKNERLLPAEEAAKLQAARSRCLAQLRERFQAFGVCTFMEELVRFLEPLGTPEDKRKLQQFLNLAAGFSQNSRLERIADFVEYIQKSVKEDPSAASVVLMTIHKSKGLQFDAVVLPEIDHQIAGKQPPKFVPGYLNDDVLQDVSLVTPVPNKNIKGVFLSENSPILQAMELHTQECVRESLSTLYVAMTRAVYAMYIFVAPKEKASKLPTSIAELLRISFTGEETAPPETRLVWDGDAQWYLRTPNALKEKEKEKEKEKTQISETGIHQKKDLDHEETPALRPEDSSAQTASGGPAAFIEPIRFGCDPASSRNLTRRAPSNIEDRRFVDLSKKIDFSQQNTVNGSILHSWYEKIAWVENSLPSDEELIAAARPFGLAKERLERLLKSFHNSLKAPKLHRVLHWTTYLPMLREKILKAGILAEEQIPGTVTRKDPADPNEIRWEVYCEKELAIRTEDELLLGTLDRLILLRNDSEIFWADCIDYKTTRKVSSPEVLEEKIRSHQQQMADYRKMLRLHYRIPDSRISTHLVFSMLGVVREV